MVILKFLSFLALAPINRNFHFSNPGHGVTRTDPLILRRIFSRILRCCWTFPLCALSMIFPLILPMNGCCRKMIFDCWNLRTCWILSVNLSRTRLQLKSRVRFCFFTLVLAWYFQKLTGEFRWEPDRNGTATTAPAISQKSAKEAFGKPDWIFTSGNGFYLVEFAATMA